MSIRDVNSTLNMSNWIEWNFFFLIKKSERYVAQWHKLINTNTSRRTHIHTFYNGNAILTHKRTTDSTYVFVYIFIHFVSLCISDYTLNNYRHMLMQNRILETDDNVIVLLVCYACIDSKNWDSFKHFFIFSQVYVLLRLHLSFKWTHTHRHLQFNVLSAKHFDVSPKVCTRHSNTIWIHIHIIRQPNWIYN